MNIDDLTPGPLTLGRLEHCGATVVTNADGRPIARFDVTAFADAELFALARAALDDEHFGPLFRGWMQEQEAGR